MFFGLLGDRETRSDTIATVTGGDAGEWRTFFNQDVTTTVTEDAALSVPAIWCAVNVIAGTIAHLPLHLYKMVDDEPVKATNDPLYGVIHDYANDYHTKFDFWKLIVSRALIGGRGLALILRNKSNRVAGLLPIDEREVTIRQTIINGVVKRSYTHNGKEWQGTDVIDLAPLLRADGISAYSPIAANAPAIAAIIASERYASSMFANGGVPPLALSGPAGSPAAMDRASEQVSEAIRAGKDRKRQMVPLPTGFDLKPIGFEPSKQQLVELRKWQTSEVSRIYNIAPALLHDLTTGTYSNVEQQSLNFAQQTILPIVKMIEQELNLKLFGKRNTTNFVEFNVDAVVRGDLKSRMDALSRAVNSGLKTPNEGRALDNLPPLPGGDRLYIQGATVPLEDAGKQPVTPPSPDAPVDQPVEDPNAD